MKRIITLLIISFVLISCGSQTEEKKATPEVLAKKEVALKNIEVDIEGMTCEIGCARLIQSKLSKVDGVTYTKVSFEAGKGQFTFDANQISAEDVINNIEKIAGGDLYSVSDSREIPEITMKSETLEATPIESK